MEKEQIIQVAGEVAKNVGKDVYTDVAHPAAKNIGNFFGTITGFFSEVVMYPLKKLNSKYECKAIEFRKKNGRKI